MTIFKFYLFPDEARGWIPSDLGTSYFAQLYSSSLNNQLSELKDSLHGIQERIITSSPTENIKQKFSELKHGFSDIKEKIASYDVPFRVPKFSASKLKSQLGRLKDGLADIKERISSSAPDPPKFKAPNLKKQWNNLKDKLSGISDKFLPSPSYPLNNTSYQNNHPTFPNSGYHYSHNHYPDLQISNTKQHVTKLAKITKSVTSNFFNSISTSLSRNSATRKVAQLFNDFGGWNKLRNFLRNIYVRMQNRQRIVPPSLTAIRRQSGIDVRNTYLPI